VPLLRSQTVNQFSPLPRNARVCVRPIHRRPLRPTRTRKPWPHLRRILRHFALRNRARRRPPARCILRHLAHLHASALRLRHPTVAIAGAIPVRQQNSSAVRPSASRQKRQCRHHRDRAQTHPLYRRNDHPPEGGPVHTASLFRFRKKTDSSQPHQIPLQK
jgi:hypothetical protein